MPKPRNILICALNDEAEQIKQLPPEMVGGIPEEELQNARVCCTTELIPWYLAARAPVNAPRLRTFVRGPCRKDLPILVQRIYDTFLPGTTQPDDSAYSANELYNGTEQDLLNNFPCAWDIPDAVIFTGQMRQYGPDCFATTVSDPEGIEQLLKDIRAPQITKINNLYPEHAA